MNCIYVQEEAKRGSLDVKRFPASVGLIYSQTFWHQVYIRGRKLQFCAHTHTHLCAGTNINAAQQSEMCISIMRFRRWNKVLPACSSSLPARLLVPLLNPLRLNDLVFPPALQTLIRLLRDSRLARFFKIHLWSCQPATCAGVVFFFLDANPISDAGLTFSFVAKDVLMMAQCADEGKAELILITLI